MDRSWKRFWGGVLSYVLSVCNTQSCLLTTGTLSAFVCYSAQGFILIDCFVYNLLLCFMDHWILVSLWIIALCELCLFTKLWLYLLALFEPFSDISLRWPWSLPHVFVPLPNLKSVFVHARCLLSYLLQRPPSNTEQPSSNLLATS